MTYSGGRLAINVGAAALSHALASRPAFDCSARFAVGRIGSSRATDSSVASRFIHSRRNLSPRLRPSARITASAPVRISTSEALTSGSSSFWDAWAYSDTRKSSYIICKGSLSEESQRLPGEAA